VFGTNPVIVVLVVDPVIPPGLMVQLPAGNPLSATLPVSTEQVGCVIIPMTGATGVAGNGFTTALTDANEIHPAAFVTVKLYVFGTNPAIVVLVVDPVIPPGLMVQLPAGNPLSATLPVATEQVGCVIIPTTGEVGVAGNGFITALTDAKEIQPVAFVTVKL